MVTLQGEDPEAKDEEGEEASMPPEGGQSAWGCPEPTGWGRTEARWQSSLVLQPLLFSTQGKVQPCEGRQNQLVNVKNINIPPYSMSWVF